MCFLGASNPFLVGIFLALSAVWGLGAMPMMSSAFMQGDVCAFEDPLECNFTKGSITEEFALSGSRSSLADWTTSSFLMGNMLGGTLLTRLSDWCGRRPVLITSMLMFGTTGLISSVVPNIYLLAFMRFLQGIFFTGCVLTNWVLAYESSPRALRAYSALTFGLLWVVGYFALTPLAYFIHGWRKLIFFASLPSVIFGSIYYFFIPESFHWLVSKGRKEEVVRWINRADKWRKSSKALKVDVDALIANAHKTDDQCSTKEMPAKGLFHQLMTNRLLFLYTCVMAYLWTCDTFVYYGLSLFSTQLDGDRYVNYALSGFVEVPCYIVSPVLLHKLGRRAFVSLTHLVTSLCFLIVSFTEVGTTFTLCIWLIGKFAISSAYASIFVYASEVFPTVYRTGCIGMCEVVARFGGVFAPIIRTMSVLSPALPTIFFSVTSGIAALLTLLLPETVNKELPDIPSQMGRKKRKTLLV
jgi:OCT family organic cation transporter-like MFS transporter 4/5